mgnify:CR=1 FL=1
MKNATYVGIDIGSQSFEAAYQNQKGRWRQRSFSNDVKGFEKLTQFLPPKAWVISEASGPYFLPLAAWLQQHDVVVSVVNPLQLRRFAQMKLIRAKTDAVDARMAALYGVQQQPPQWKQPSRLILQMRQLLSHLQLMIKHKTALSNQIHSHKASGVTTEFVLTRQQAELSQLSDDIAQTEAELQRLTQEVYGDLYERLTTIPGIGPKAAVLLIVLTDGFSRFPSAKALSSYVGLASHPWSSGKSVKGRGKISKIGAPQLRACLYMCAQSSYSCNVGCKAMRERMLANGKPKLVIRVAVAHKLLRQAWAIGYKGGVYDPALA